MKTQNEKQSSQEFVRKDRKKKNEGARCINNMAHQNRRKLRKKR